jgi:iron only hydrogenase large subunit-like protein
MSAILSADDLNDFISPGVACIKPIESLPANNSYEVTTEDKVAASAPAQISLTDCLACSGCVTSAEAMLVSLQSHTEVLNALDKHPAIRITDSNVSREWNGNSKLFVASVSPQARASLAAAFGVSEFDAGNMIEHFLTGSNGLGSGGANGSSFTWVLDTNIPREAVLVSSAEEVTELLQEPQRQPAGDGVLLTDKPKKPILSSACPGWICYVEKTFPHILPHLSRLKSPQALAGTLLKSTLYKTRNIHPSQVWHLAVMPCFDKKLEASRSELTSDSWLQDGSEPSRDVDCVITVRELLSLAAARGIDFASLPRTSPSRTPFPDTKLDAFLFPRTKHVSSPDVSAGTSGGYLWHTLRRLQAQHPGSRIVTTRGRNADVMDFALYPADGSAPIVKLARYYGFRNIQNLVRKLKPKRANRLLLAADRSGARKPNGSSSAESVEYAYVEVMACPGGCTNGGGQMRIEDIAEMAESRGREDASSTAATLTKKDWLTTVDQKYWAVQDDDEDLSGSESTDGESFVNENHRLSTANGVSGHDGDVVDNISRSYILDILNHWSILVGVDKQELICTSYRKVESDVGKKKGSDVDRVAALAGSIGGGW